MIELPTYLHFLKRGPDRVFAESFTSRYESYVTRHIASYIPCICFLRLHRGPSYVVFDSGMK